MKRIDFENGTVTGNILGAALPMLAAQLLNLLYNIVDRVYIARIPHDHYWFWKSILWRWCAAVFDLHIKKIT